MLFTELKAFLAERMRMSHIYQPLMLKTLLERGGRASVQQIAQALLSEDRSQREYYAVGGVNYLVRPATTILAGWRRGMISS